MGGTVGGAVVGVAVVDDVASLVVLGDVSTGGGVVNAFAMVVGATV